MKTHSTSTAPTSGAPASRRLVVAIAAIAGLTGLVVTGSADALGGPHAATKKTTKSAAKSKTATKSRPAPAPTAAAAPPAVGIKCQVLGSVATDPTGQTLICLRRGTEVVWSPAIPTTVAPTTPPPPPTAAPLPVAPVGTGNECLNGKWTFGPNEAQGVWEQYGIALRVLQGKLDGLPAFSGSATLTFAGATVTGTGSVLMKGKGILATQEKYGFDISWAPIATGSVAVVDNRIELSNAATSLFTGALTIDGRPVNGGRVIAPRDGLQSLAFRCEKTTLTLFLPTFLSEVDGDKVFTYTLVRG